MGHPLDSIPIKSGDNRHVREFLRALPKDTFPHVDEFVRDGSLVREGPGESRRAGVHALLYDHTPTEKGLAIVLLDPHLGEDVQDILGGMRSTLNIPEAATRVHFYAGKMPPSNGGYVAGVGFEYEQRKYAFLIENTPKKE